MITRGVGERNLCVNANNAHLAWWALLGRVRGQASLPSVTVAVWLSPPRV